VLKILRSTYISLFIIAALLLFLFRGIFETYAYTDGYDFAWNRSNTDFINVFLQQGRFISGWIFKMLFLQIDHISDLFKIRLLNLTCLFLSSALIYRMLKRNNINEFYALAIVIVFICSPFASIVVHWEATSSTIWGYPLALLAGELVFTAYLNKKKPPIYVGILFALVSLFIYQPAYTAFIIPAFLHFITGQKRDVLKRFLFLHFFIYGLYFLLFRFQLNQLAIPPDGRAGIMISLLKPLIFIKGVFVRSLHYNIIFASVAVQLIIIVLSLMVIGYFVYDKIRNENKNDKWNFMALLALFYVLGYFPNFISSDNFVAYRTMGTVIFISSFLLISSVASLPLRSMYLNALIAIVVVVSIAAAYFNNKTFTGIQSKEYADVKAIVAEKLKQGYPKKIMLIRVEENFLVEQNLVANVVTDEFGKLSNSVDWAPKPFVLQEIYELTNDKPKAETIEVISYKRTELPADSIIQKNDWVLDIEKIYLNSGIKP
jgi:hypothetical protein